MPPLDHPRHLKLGVPPWAQRPARHNGRFSSARFSTGLKNASQLKQRPATCKPANWKIRVNKTIIIDDDMDIDTRSLSSFSGSPFSLSKHSDIGSSRLPRIDRSQIRKQRTLKVSCSIVYLNSLPCHWRNTTKRRQKEILNTLSVVWWAYTSSSPFTLRKKIPKSHL